MARGLVGSRRRKPCFWSVDRWACTVDVDVRPTASSASAAPANLVPARVLARCAVEDRATLVTPLIRLGTPVRYIPGASTATFTMSYVGDVREMHVEALGDVWLPREVPELPASGRWVHVAPLSRSDFPTETVAALARRLRVSFDGQGLVRVPALGPLQLDGDFDREILRSASFDSFCCAARSSMAFTVSRAWYSKSFSSDSSFCSSSRAG